MIDRCTICRGIAATLCALLFCTVLSAGEAQSLKPQKPHATGLLSGRYNPSEPVAKTRAEFFLAIRPRPRTSQIKPYWLYVPSSYRKDKPLPLLIALHPRGPLRSFSGALNRGHLKTYAAETLSAWKPVAEKQGFMLFVPLGDPDTLWMGVSWFTGDRTRLLRAQIETVARTHNLDRSRVYVVGSGSGAHAAIATAVRRGDLIAAVAACNPPLFADRPPKKNVVYPELVPDMLKGAGKRKTPLLIYAGDKDKTVKIHRHLITAVADARYQDSSSIPAETIKKAADALKAKSFPVEFKTLTSRHHAPLPATQTLTVWQWLKTHSISKDALAAPAPELAGAPLPPAPAKKPAGKAKSKPRPWLGVMLDGVSIKLAVPGGPAAKAGLKSGDKFLEIGGRKITSRTDIILALLPRAPGDKVTVKIERDGKQQQLELTIGKRAAGGPRLPSRTTGSRHYSRKARPLMRAESMKAGLAWLAKQQREDGSFPTVPPKGVSMKFPIAVTSLAAMALMLDDAHAAQVEKALAFVTSACHPDEDGYIYHQKASFKGFWEHCFGTQLLAEALIRKRVAKADAERVAALQKHLERAVKLIVKAQNIEGGWGYRPIPDPHSEVGPAAAALDALLLARKAGVKVEGSVIDRALKSQCLLMLSPRAETVQGEWRSFSYEANAFTLASLTGWKDRPATAVYLKAIQGVDPEAYFKRFIERSPMVGVYWATGNHTLGLYYASLAFRRMGEDQQERFAAWHKQVSAHLAKIQRKDGAWQGWFGDVYGTAFSCLTLAAVESNKLAHLTPAGGSTPPHKIEVKNAAAVKLKATTSLTLKYALAKAATRHRWQGFKKTVAAVGLKSGTKAWTDADLQGLFPKEAIGVGSRWAIPDGPLAKLLSPFHETVATRMEAKVTSRKGALLTIQLRGLAKFGKPKAGHVQTTTFRGQILVDVNQGRVTSLKLKPVSGCIRVKQGRGKYVALSDIRLSVSN
jgi:dienelactone hydrolase